MAQRRLLIFCLPLSFLFVFSQAQAQIKSPYKNIFTSLNAAALDTVAGAGLDINLSNPQPKHGSLSTNIISVGGANLPYVYQIRYQPDPGFIGVDSFVLEYHYASAAPYLVYQGFRVTVKSSLVHATDDHVTTSMNTAVVIPVLANDHSDWGALAVETLPVVNGGTAYVNSNQQIVFNPKAGFTGIAHINYLVCDALHTCETANVSIGVHGNVPDDAALQVFTDRNNPLEIPLTYDGYVLQTSPAHGSAQLKNGNFVVYQPAHDFTGQDMFVLKTIVNGIPHSKSILVKVYDTPVDNKMAMDDVLYTAKGQAVTFNVRDNDLGNLLVRSWQTPANFPGTLSSTSTSGTVTFTPNPDFTGVATFTYKLGNSWAPALETATVSIVVDNLTPPVKFPYRLETPKNTPFVLRYDIPFSNFTFQILHQPQFGMLEYFPGNTTQHVNGQSVSGNNLVIYTPDNNFVGIDQISLVYCAPNGQCRNVNLDMRVVEPNNVNPPFCIGDCVWPGDVNQDHFVNNQDLLPLGYLMGVEGQGRPDPSMDWYAQFSGAWNDKFHGMKTDIKHADADGSGTIDAEDVNVIHENYYKASNLFPPSYPVGKGLPFSVSLMPQDPDNEKLIKIQISLGNDQFPASNVYGITFDATLGPGIVDSAFHMTFYENSWLNRNSPFIQLSERPEQGHFETAFSRTSGKPASGQGPIGELGFIIIVVEGGGQNNRPASITLHPTIQFVDGSSTQGDPITLALPELRSVQKTRPPTFDHDQVFAFPTPADDKLSVSWNFPEPVERLALLDLNGKLVLEQNTAEDSSDELLQVGHLPSGVYILQLQTAGKIVSKKVEIGH